MDDLCRLNCNVSFLQSLSKTEMLGYQVDEVGAA